MENLFQKRLKKLRIENNLSQKKLAESLNIDKSVISSYELGKTLPNCQTLINIAYFFNVSIDYIVGVTNKYSAFPIDNEIAQDPDEPYFSFSIYVYELNRLYERSDIKTQQILSEIFKIFFYHFLGKELRKKEQKHILKRHC